MGTRRQLLAVEVVLSIREVPSIVVLNVINLNVSNQMVGAVGAGRGPHYVRRFMIGLT